MNECSYCGRYHNESMCPGCGAAGQFMDLGILAQDFSTGGFIDPDVMAQISRDVHEQVAFEANCIAGLRRSIVPRLDHVPLREKRTVRPPVPKPGILAW